MTRLGFLGNHAPFAADVNLITQILALSSLLAGVYFVRAGKLRTHSRLMKSAIVVQFGALILWMGPSLILNIGVFSTFGSGQLITAVHVFAGVFALALAISAASHRSVISTQLRWTMWTTFIIWILAAVFGIIFYLHYYLL